MTAEPIAQRRDRRETVKIAQALRGRRSNTRISINAHRLARWLDELDSIALAVERGDTTFDGVPIALVLSHIAYEIAFAARWGNALIAAEGSK